MADILADLARLQRPRLLVQAARFGLADYRRERDLPRLLQGAQPKTPAAVLDKLMELEARQDERRRAADAGYSYGKHIELLIALMAEARAYLASQSADITPLPPRKAA